MFDSWWKAHEFEFVLSGIVFGACFVVWIVASLAVAFTETRRARKRFDEQYRQLTRKR